MCFQETLPMAEENLEDGSVKEDEGSQVEAKANPTAVLYHSLCHAQYPLTLTLSTILSLSIHLFFNQIISTVFSKEKKKIPPLSKVEGRENCPQECRIHFISLH